MGKGRRGFTNEYNEKENCWGHLTANKKRLDAFLNLIHYQIKLEIMKRNVNYLLGKNVYLIVRKSQLFMGHFIKILTKHYHRPL